MRSKSETENDVGRYSQAINSLFTLTFGTFTKFEKFRQRSDCKPVGNFPLCYFVPLLFKTFSIS
jgi:hypothetical protein